MTKTLGSRANASLILAHVKQHSYMRKWSRYCPGDNYFHRREVGEYVIEEVILNIPDGWKYLGSGWSRDAFLGPDGVVYKVARSGRYQSRSTALNCSRSEAKFYKANCEKARSIGLRLAACRLLNNSVLAMEYVPHDKTKTVVWADITKAEIHLGLSDLHTGNVAMDENGVLTIIDYAA